MHQDKFRTGPPNKAYSEGHARIFGKRVERRPETKEETKRREANRRNQHAIEARDGKKDAQYYLQHEQRVAQDPNFKASPAPSKVYCDGYNKVFGEK